MSRILPVVSHPPATDMSVKQSVSLIMNYKRTSTYALNVLLGSLEGTDFRGALNTFLEYRPDALAELARQEAERGSKVVVGWSFYSPEIDEIFPALERLKAQVGPDRVINIAGGVHATAEPERTLRAGFDYVAIGEGEVTLSQFLLRLIAGQDPATTQGVASLRNGQLSSMGPGPRVDLDDFPPYAESHRKFNPIEITRGCIYACKFCQTPFMFKARFRHRSVERVCHYVEVMKSYGLTDVRFITPTALSYGSSDESVNLEEIERLLSSIRGTLGDKGRIFFGTFPSELRPEHVSLEALRMLKRYVANDNLIVGGQAGSNRVLEASGRGHSVADIERAVKICREVGFVPNVDFIFGLPGETRAEMKASLDLAERLSTMGARIHGHTFMPLPGTPYTDAPAGRIPADIKRQLARLEGRGKLYGQWKDQERIARMLVETSGRPRRIRTPKSNARKLTSKRHP